MGGNRANVQIVENWTDIKGVLRDWHPAERLENFTTLEVDVDETRPVEGFANLADSLKGSRIRIHVRNSALADVELVSGATLECRIRRAGLHSIFADPEHLKITATKLPD